MSKRIKITFETINKGNYTVIDPKDIANTIIHLLQTPDDFLPLDLEVRTMNAKY